MINKSGFSLISSNLSILVRKSFSTISKRSASNYTVDACKVLTEKPVLSSAAAATAAGCHRSFSTFSSSLWMNPIVCVQSYIKRYQQSSCFSTVTSRSTSQESSAEPYRPPGWELLQSQPRPEERIRGALVGVVVSDKMQKTVNVAVDRFKFNHKYNKRIRFTRKFMAHDEDELCNMGDLVKIVPDRRRSRHKHFRVYEIIRAKGML
jgi:small subunit ribosomal protein S17